MESSFSTLYAPFVLISRFRIIYGVFFIKIPFIRIPRLRFDPNILAISENIRLGICLTVLIKNLCHGMHFKAISDGGGSNEMNLIKTL